MIDSVAPHLSPGSSLPTVWAHCEVTSLVLPVPFLPHWAACRLCEWLWVNEGLSHRVRSSPFQQSGPAMLEKGAGPHSDLPHRRKENVLILLLRSSSVIVRQPKGLCFLGSMHQPQSPALQTQCPWPWQTHSRQQERQPQSNTAWFPRAVLLLVGDLKHYIGNECWNCVTFKGEIKALQRDCTLLGGLRAPLKLSLHLQTNDSTANQGLLGEGFNASS